MIEKLINFLENLSTPLQLTGIGMILLYLIPEKIWYISIVTWGLFVLAIVEFLSGFGNRNNED